MPYLKRFAPWTWLVSPALRLAPFTFISIMGVFVALIAAAVIGYYHESSLADDSYMTIRYADNLMHHGKLSWNADGPPTYGMTSNLLVFWSIPFRLIFPTNATMAVMWLSIVAGIGFLVALFAMLWRCSTIKGLTRYVCLIAVFLPIVFGLHNLAAHFTSGVDTCLTLLVLTGYIAIALSFARAPSLASGLGLGIYGGLAYSARPDLALFTCAVPFCIVLFAGKPSRRYALLALILTVSLILAQMAFGLVYFHSLLPLPFYVKGERHYGPEMYRQLGGMPASQLASFWGNYCLLFIMIALGVAVSPVKWWKERSGVEIGLILATACFIIYYRNFVLQILSAHQRFYYPVLPALVYLAYQACGRIAWFLARWPTISRLATTRIVLSFASVFALCGAFVTTAQCVRSAPAYNSV